MAGKFPSLNVVFWNGEDIGKDADQENYERQLKRREEFLSYLPSKEKYLENFNRNSTYRSKFCPPDNHPMSIVKDPGYFQSVIISMLRYCYNINFISDLSLGGKEREKPDLIILGEIYPMDIHKDTSLYQNCLSRFAAIDDYAPGFRAKIVPIKRGSERGKEVEHFLVAFNVRTVAELELEFIELSRNKKAALKINVRQTNSEGMLSHFFYRIIAVHLECSKGEESVKQNLSKYLQENCDPSTIPHLVIGDTNFNGETTYDKNSVDGNAFLIPKQIKELSFLNQVSGSTFKNGQQTNSRPDRAWFAHGSVEAMGYYLGLEKSTQRTLHIVSPARPAASLISTHLVMAVRLINEPSKSIEGELETLQRLVRMFRSENPHDVESAKAHFNTLNSDIKNAVYELIEMRRVKYDTKFEEIVGLGERLFNDIPPFRLSNAQRANAIETYIRRSPSLIYR